MKAKNVTLVAQIITAVWVAAWHCYKFLTSAITTQDIILSGITIAACFSPVYFNMILDHIKDLRFNNKE